MKKSIQLVLFLVSAFSFAQEREKGTIEVTPIIGYGSSSYIDSNNTNNSSIYSSYSEVNSADFGVNGDYYFNDRWSLRSSLLFQSMGSKYYNGQIEDNLEYLSIPINANWHFGSTRKWNLNFGPSFGFLMSAESNGIDIKNQVESFQFGLSVGIGYKIEITENIGILVDFQGFSSFTDAITSTDLAGVDLNVKNSYSALNVGCVFKL